jgi:hypothetical protein
VSRNPGDLATGSGSGRFHRGERIRQIGEIRVGDLFIEDSHQFDATNVCRVIKIRDGNKFVASFVNSANPESSRLWSDQPFCVWDFDLRGEMSRFYRAAEGAEPLEVKSNGAG